MNDPNLLRMLNSSAFSANTASPFTNIASMTNMINFNPNPFQPDSSLGVNNSSCVDIDFFQNHLLNSMKAISPNSDGFTLRDFISQTTPILPSTPSPKPSSTFAFPSCKVCGGEFRNKTGIQMCKNCKEFKKRNVSNVYVDRCSQLGKCEVKITLIRQKIQCRACRLKKCLDYEKEMNVEQKQETVQFKKPFPPTSPLLKHPSPPEINELVAPNPEIEIQHVKPITALDPHIQFSNIRDATKSFLPEVLAWPRTIPLFQELSRDEKISLIQSQWIYLSFLTICENGAHLLNLQEDLSIAAHTFHRLAPRADEVSSMKAVMLFMQKQPDRSFTHQFHLDDSIEELKTKTDYIRFNELLELLGTVAHLPLANVRNMFGDAVNNSLLKNF